MILIHSDVISLGTLLHLQPSLDFYSALGAPLLLDPEMRHAETPNSKMELLYLLLYLITLFFGEEIGTFQYKSQKQLMFLGDI